MFLYSLSNQPLVAQRFELLYTTLQWISVFGFCLTIGAIVYFSIFYRRSKVNPDQTPYLEGNARLELSIAGILLVLVTGLFYWGWVDYKKLRSVPPSRVLPAVVAPSTSVEQREVSSIFEDPLEIQVTGFQWYWTFQYLNGHFISTQDPAKAEPVVVPVGRPVKFVLTSNDVIHSFFIPDFRLKQDAVPGQFTYLTITPSSPGEHVVFCAEYCGKSHASMMVTIKAVMPEGYEKWQSDWQARVGLGTWGLKELPSKEKKDDFSLNPDPVKEVSVLNLAEKGKQVFVSKQCLSCHSVDGSSGVGPALKGIFNKEVELADGSRVRVDENYIRESVIHPRAKIVKGYPSVMAPYLGSITNDELQALIVYLKGL